jgi:hypothetical protein
MRTIPTGWFLLALLYLGSLAASAQTPARDYRTVLQAARRDTVETDSVRVTDLDLGRAVVGTDTFRAVLRNKVASTVTVCVDLRATAGLWLRANFQAQRCLDLAPREVRHVAVAYQFRRLSPEGGLRIRLGRGRDPEGSVTSLFFDRRYELGRGNPAAVNLAAEFTHLEAGHLDIWARRGSLAERDLDSIAVRRERALSDVARLLDVVPPDTVRLVFYPDSASKTSETGHIGAGLAFGATLVEIYNDSIRLDPYHELVHIIAIRLGEPPALLTEGFAVYTSERLGADALALLGSPGREVDSAACGFARGGSLIPLDSLFDFTEIGSAKSRPTVAYAQAASLVKFLVETYGVVPFRQAYRTLVSSDSAVARERNRAEFSRIFGASLGEVERRWYEHLRCN